MNISLKNLKKLSLTQTSKAKNIIKIFAWVA